MLSKFRCLMELGGLSHIFLFIFRPAQHGPAGMLLVHALQLVGAEQDSVPEFVSTENLDLQDVRETRMTFNLATSK